MVCLKILYSFFVISCIFIYCSVAQEKPLSTPSDKVILQNKIFESKTGNFSINIYQEPFQILDLSSAIQNKKGIDGGKQFVWKLERKIYTVMYSDEFDSNKTKTTQIFEDMKIGSRKGILNKEAKLISEKPISYGKYPGREFRYVSKEGVNFIGRIYLIKTIGYQIVGGYADELDKKEILKVLDSFKLLSEKK